MYHHRIGKTQTDRQTVKKGIERIQKIHGEKSAFVSQQQSKREAKKRNTKGTTQ